MAMNGPLIDCEVTAFLRGANPIWTEFDLVGNLFDDTFYLWVLTNTIPYNLVQVFHDPSGLIPWTQPIQFLANGTLPIDIYFANNTIYRLEFRKNTPPAPPSQNDQLIYLVENYNPSQAVDVPMTNSSSGMTNQITNPQFAFINFNSPLMLTGITNPPAIEIAPGWFLDLTGTGNITVTQVPLNNATANPTNAPYYMNFQTSGWANAPVLRQRFFTNGMNWANQFIASSFTALEIGAPTIISTELVDSNGTVLNVLQTQTLTATPQEYRGVVQLPGTTNPDLPPVAYIDFKVLLPTSGNTYLTSFQIIASGNNITVPYQQDTVDRQFDQTAHDFMPKLAAKPIPSYLIGWDFPLNPAQIVGTAIPATGGTYNFTIGANKSQYAWDQTLIFQTVQSGVAISRDANTGGLKITAAQTGQFAVIQYLDQVQARELLLNGEMSVYISGLSNNAAGYVGNISLWATTDPNLPNANAGTNNSLVTALSATGHPTCGNGNWNEIPRGNLGPAGFDFANFIINGSAADWNASGQAYQFTATYFAIVIGFQTIQMNDTITINQVGLYSSPVPTVPAPKTHDETLRDCERFYEKSYQASAWVGIVTLNVGPITTYNELQAPIVGDVPRGGGPYTGNAYSTSFTVEYRTLKRAPATQGFPTLTLYSPATGAAGQVSCASSGGATITADKAVATYYVPVVGNKFCTFQANPGAMIATTQTTTDQYSPILGYVNYHYVADSRLGIVN